MPVPDPDALRVGRLAVTFDWPLGADILTLKAVYPDTFPRLRPGVFLIDGLDPWPERHVNPHDGNLCLLGRDSRQWMSRWTLRQLLDEQLEDAIRGGGEEDLQGEPAEVWWNSAGAPGAYCLIDSAWDPGNVRQGTLQLRYAVDGIKEHVPIVRAVVTDVCDENGTVLFRWEGPLPPDVRGPQPVSPSHAAKNRVGYPPREGFFHRRHHLRSLRRTHARDRRPHRARLHPSIPAGRRPAAPTAAHRAAATTTANRARVQRRLNPGSGTNPCRRAPRHGCVQL